ncbi:MAG TPA: nucleotide sugar dehydrogenase [Devosia sp.]|jgi:UDP-N-acetyl-D-mannosaminuronic acid dehydrogenase|nr:nucleotide sugar dehydrogenase [Devosia sp.]
MSEQLRIAVVGLGYVGLTLSVALARRGVKVYGIEKRSQVVEMTNKGIPHFSEVGLDAALEEVTQSGMFVAAESLDGVQPLSQYIITVGTPLKQGTHMPRLDMIQQATEQVAAHMGNGASVILRSTVRVGTTNEVVRPILDATGRKFHLSMCPERTLEGDALRELATLPQIIGGVDDAAADLAASLFSRLTHTIVRVASPETAEMIKLVDNTSRDVRFAFANEVARACDALGINALDVIRFGKLGYARTNVALPGLVGGPCLEKDPHILLSSVADAGIDLEITRASRLVNERQPAETVDHIVDLLEKRGLKAPFTATIAGLAFKGIPETDDLRGSMSLKVLDAMKASGKFATLRAFDKVVSRDQMEALPYDLQVHDTLEAAVSGSDVLIIANNHPVFGTISIDMVDEIMSKGAIVFDFWNNLVTEAPAKLKNRYFSTGNRKGVY